MFNPALVPELETKRLILKGHTSATLPDSAAMWADPKVVLHISGKPSTYEQCEQRLARYNEFWRTLKYGYWAVYLKATGVFIGEVGFADWRREITPNISGIPEAGWVLKTEAHGKGYATEAVKSMLEWADLSPQFDKTVCILDPEYRASKRVARKVGFGNKKIGDFKGMPTLIMERRRIT